jgi:hypothetical protein
MNSETDDLTKLDVTQLRRGLPVAIVWDALPQVELSGVVEHKRICHAGQAPRPMKT